MRTWFCRHCKAVRTTAEYCRPQDHYCPVLRGVVVGWASMESFETDAVNRYLADENNLPFAEEIAE